jgi:hypothetical protein
VVRLTFQPARCGYTLRVTSKTSKYIYYSQFIQVLFSVTVIQLCLVLIAQQCVVANWSSPEDLKQNFSTLSTWQSNIIWQTFCSKSIDFFIMHI